MSSLKRTARFLIASAAYVLLFTAPCRAGAGKTGFDFLSDAPGARSAAMGGVVSSVADDVESSLWNPAALAEMRQGQLGLGYASYLSGMTQGVLAYGQPLATGAFGLSARTLDSGNITAYNASDARTGSYDVKDMALSGGYGRSFGSWRWGANVKQAGETLAGHSAHVMGADGGLLYRRPSWPVTFAAALRNLGGKASFGGEKTPLPRSLDLGANVRLLGDAVLLAAETHRGADGESVIAAGGEVWLYNVLAFRAGWQNGTRAGNGLGLGLGVKVNSLRVDYSFAANGDGFTPTHRMGISWRFGAPGERLYQEGVALLQRGQTAEAVLKFQAALDADPKLPRAVQALREAVRRLREEMREESLPEQPR